MKSNFPRKRNMESGSENILNVKSYHHNEKKEYSSEIIKFSLRLKFFAKSLVNFEILCFNNSHFLFTFNIRNEYKIYILRNILKQVLLIWIVILVLLCSLDISVNI